MPPNTSKYTQTTYINSRTGLHCTCRSGGGSDPLWKVKLPNLVLHLQQKLVSGVGRQTAGNGGGFQPFKHLLNIAGAAGLRERLFKRRACQALVHQEPASTTAGAVNTSAVRCQPDNTPASPLPTNLRTNQPASPLPTNLRTNQPASPLPTNLRTNLWTSQPIPNQPTNKSTSQPTPSQPAMKSTRQHTPKSVKRSMLTRRGGRSGGGGGGKGLGVERWPDGWGSKQTRHSLSIFRQTSHFGFLLNK